MNSGPYTPQAGHRPPFFVEPQTAFRYASMSFDLVIKDRSPAPIIMYGPPHMGKTVALRTLRQLATEQKFLPVWVSCQTGADNIAALNGALMDCTAETPHEVSRFYTDLLSSYYRNRAQVKISDGMIRLIPRSIQAFSKQKHSIPAIDLVDYLFEGLTRAARSNGYSGIALFIDDIDMCTPEEIQFIADSIHVVSGREFHWLSTFITGGPDILTKMNLEHYSRYTYCYLPPLQPEEATQALVRPSEQRGVGWDGAAVKLVLDAVGGCPDLIQQVGAQLWSNVSPANGETVTTEQTAKALNQVLNQLTATRFDRWWAEASEDEQRWLLAAVDALTEKSQVDLDRVQELTGAPTHVVRRAEILLKDRGVLWGVGEDPVAFVVPAFKDYLRTMSDNRK